MTRIRQSNPCIFHILSTQVSTAEQEVSSCKTYLNWLGCAPQKFQMPYIIVYAVFEVSQSISITQELQVGEAIWGYCVMLHAGIDS